jgi:hypothetical protein
MNIPECPKKMRNCPESNCPSYPCWAYEKYLDGKDREKKTRDQGWE